MDPEVAAVYALIQANTHVDSTLISRLNDAQAEIATTKSLLTGAGFSSLATLLDNYDTSDNLTTLATYINDTNPTLVERMSIFASVTTLEDGDGTEIGTAFGGLFGGRSFVSAVDDIAATLDDLSAYGAQDNLTARTNQLAGIPAAVPALIAAEEIYFTEAAQKLNSYSEALQIIQMFEQYPMKAVIGAVGSDALLAILNPQPTIDPDPPEPPVDGSGSGVADPVPPPV